jgi:hypothetical protein
MREFLEEVQLTATIHEFLFKVTKDSHGVLAAVHRIHLNRPLTTS